MTTTRHAKARLHALIVTALLVGAFAMISTPSQADASDGDLVRIDFPDDGGGGEGGYMEIILAGSGDLYQVETYLAPEDPEPLTAYQSYVSLCTRPGDCPGDGGVANNVPFYTPFEGFGSGCTGSGDLRICNTDGTADVTLVTYNDPTWQATPWIWGGVVCARVYHAAAPQPIEVDPGELGALLLPAALSTGGTC